MASALDWMDHLRGLPMILKRADERHPANALEAAGVKAEKQMAHYLDRAFLDDPDVFVFHDIRFELDGDTAQIDHLILYTCGFHIVESKSVTSTIRVNEQDGWERLWNGAWKGMASPILQAQRQGEFLARFLNKNAHHMLKAALPFIEFDYRKLRFEPWVAISDDGVIHQKVQPPHGNLLKADQIPDALREQIEEDKRALSLKDILTSSPFKDCPNWIQDDALKRLAKWVANAHRPKHREAAPPRVDPLEFREPDIPNKHVASDDPETKRCWRCSSRNLQVRRKNGHYFHCLECGANTAIRFACRTDACRPDLKETGDGFFMRVCAHCGTERPYYRNL